MTRTVTIDRPGLGRTRARLPELVRAGCRRVELADPVDLTLDTAESLSAAQLIRDATGYGLSVTWTLGVPPAENALWTHLFPPSAAGASAARHAAERWRNSHRFGACHFRVGPSFVTVKDVRPAAEMVRMVIELPDAESFVALADGDAVDPAGPDTASTIASLAGLGLCRVGAAGVLLLPYRIHRRPTCADLI